MKKLSTSTTEAKLSKRQEQSLRIKRKGVLHRPQQARNFRVGQSTRHLTKNNSGSRKALEVNSLYRFQAFGKSTHQKT